MNQIKDIVKARSEELNMQNNKLCLKNNNISSSLYVNMCETSVKIGNKLKAFEVHTEIKKQGDNANRDFVARSWSTIMDQ